MKKRLFLHIGHYKTGSSALQSFLNGAKGALKEEGVLYPNAGRAKTNSNTHARLSLGLLERHGFTPPPWYKDSGPVEGDFAALAEEIEASGCKRVVVSSEEFVQFAFRADYQTALADLKARLAAYDVKIVFYLREPFSLMKSWFNEVNKGPVPTRNFVTFAAVRPDGFFSQRPIVTRFGAAFGRRNVIIVPYRPEGQFHVQSFLDVIGSYHPVPTEVPRKQIGMSLEALETGRMSKARALDGDDFSLTRVPKMRPFASKMDHISQHYNAVAADVPGAAQTDFSVISVFDHYRDILRAIDVEAYVNPRETLILRKLAKQAAALKRADAALIVAAIEGCIQEIEAPSA